MEKPARNSICLWYNTDAEGAARFYAKLTSRPLRRRDVDNECVPCVRAL